MGSEAPRVIVPGWPAPANVRAASTTRRGGVSRGVFASLNLGEDTGDEPAVVGENRARLRAHLALPREPAWLRQVHGTEVVDAAGGGRAGDAAVAMHAGAVCAVLTADCLPVALCRDDGRGVGVAHAGWRGLAAGVLEASVRALGSSPGSMLAWLGPAIGPDAFEVGEEVRQAFVAADPAAAAAFRPSPGGRWLADLYALARQRLRACGVGAVFGGGWCTVSDPARFYSYRREGTTGRMATLIWLAD